jgi:hypothetical protein
MVFREGVIVCRRTTPFFLCHDNHPLAIQRERVSFPIIATDVLKPRLPKPCSQFMIGEFTHEEAHVGLLPLKKNQALRIDPAGEDIVVSLIHQIIPVAFNDSGRPE